MKLDFFRICRTTAFLSLFFASLQISCSKAAESLYFTSAQRLPASDNYEYLLSYCTEVSNMLTFSMSYGPSVKINGADTSPLVLQLSLTPQGRFPQYLYLTKNDIYSDTAEVKVSSDCILNSADAQSTQQLTAILTEIGQTIGSVAAAARGGVMPFSDEAPSKAEPECQPIPQEKEPDDREVCSGAIKDSIKNMPFYHVLSGAVFASSGKVSRTISLFPNSSRKEFVYTPPAAKAPEKATTDVKITGDIRISSDNRISGDTSVGSEAVDAPAAKQYCRDHRYHVAIKIDFESEGSEEAYQDSYLAGDPSGLQNGFAVYLPHPTRTTMKCQVKRLGRKKGFTEFVLSPPQVLFPYVDKEWIVPTRDFFTNPRNARTMVAGFLTGAQFVSQSKFKTVADILTSPLRALTPSVTTQTTVVTVPGKSDQVTSQTTVSPPKYP